MLGRRHTLEVAGNVEALELASLADVGWRCGVNRGASAGSIVDRRADVPQKLSTEMESTNGKRLRWREMEKTEEGLNRGLTAAGEERVTTDFAWGWLNGSSFGGTRGVSKVENAEVLGCRRWMEFGFDRWRFVVQ